MGYVDSNNLYESTYIPGYLDPTGGFVWSGQVTLESERFRVLKEAVDLVREILDLPARIRNALPIGVTPYASIWSNPWSMRAQATVEIDDNACKLKRVELGIRANYDVSGEAGLSMGVMALSANVGVFARGSLAFDAEVRWADGDGFSVQGQGNITATAGVNGGISALLARVNIWGGIQARANLTIRNLFIIDYNVAASGAIGLDVQIRTGLWRWRTVFSTNYQGADFWRGANGSISLYATAVEKMNDAINEARALYGRQISIGRFPN